MRLHVKYVHLIFVRKCEMRSQRRLTVSFADANETPFGNSFTIVKFFHQDFVTKNVIKSPKNLTKKCDKKLT